MMNIEATFIYRLIQRTKKRLPLRAPLVHTLIGNALGTFQRCMMSIFLDLLEECTDIFMDDFMVYGNSFESCLRHLDVVLKRCEEKNLVLNLKKFHFIVPDGIVLGHVVSERGIQVDKAKVDIISKLPHPTNQKVLQKVH